MRQRQATCLGPLLRQGKNCCYKFYWPSFGMAYGNPRFSELGEVLTKVALEHSRMVLCSPDWGAPGGNEYWRTLPNRLTISSVWLPDGAIYVPLGRKTPITKTRMGKYAQRGGRGSYPYPLGGPRHNPTGGRRGRPSWKGGRCSASRTRTPTTGSPGLFAAPSPTGATAGATRRRHSPSPDTSGGAGDGPDSRCESGEGSWAPPPTPPP